MWNCRRFGKSSDSNQQPWNVRALNFLDLDLSTQTQKNVTNAFIGILMLELAVRNR